MKTSAIMVFAFMFLMLLYWAIDFRVSYVEIEHKIEEPVYGIIQRKRDLQKNTYGLTVISSAGRVTDLSFFMTNRDFSKIAVGDSLSKPANEDRAKLYKNPDFHFCCELDVFRYRN